MDMNKMKRIFILPMPDSRPRLVGIADYMSADLELNYNHTMHMCMDMCND